MSDESEEWEEWQKVKAVILDHSPMERIATALEGIRSLLEQGLVLHPAEELDD